MGEAGYDDIIIHEKYDASPHEKWKKVVEMNGVSPQLCQCTFSFLLNQRTSCLSKTLTHQSLYIEALCLSVCPAPVGVSVCLISRRSRHAPTSTLVFPSLYERGERR